MQTNNSAVPHQIVPLKQKTKFTIPKLTDFDCFIQAEYEYLIGKDLYQGAFPSRHKQTLDQIKSSEKKLNCFKKWYKMSFSPDESAILSIITFNEIQKSIIKFTSNKSVTPNLISYASEITYKNSFLSFLRLNKSLIVYSSSTTCEHSIPQCETNLREYYIKHRQHLKLRVIKGPPNTFRLTAWIVCASIPKNRTKALYQEILRCPLDEEIQYQISKDISRSMETEENNNKYGFGMNMFMTMNLSNNMNNSLSNLLKAMAIIDTELSYCQGMNFICGFILQLTHNNEVETFYILVALFSHSFTNKFGIRGFYLNGFPLLQFYLYAFDIHFRKKIPKVYTKFKELEIPNECWISNWIQTLFVHILPKDAVIRVWDFMFVKGIKMLIPVSLALITCVEDLLLEVEEMTEVNDIFKNYFISPEFDIEKVIDIAEERFHISKKEMKRHKNKYKKHEGNTLFICKIKYERFNNCFGGDNNNNKGNNNDIERKISNVSETLSEQVDLYQNKRMISDSESDNDNDDEQKDDDGDDDDDDDTDIIFRTRSRAQAIVRCSKKSNNNINNFD